MLVVAREDFEAQHVTTNEVECEIFSWDWPWTIMYNVFRRERKLSFRRINASLLTIKLFEARDKAPVRWTDSQNDKENKDTPEIVCSSVLNACVYDANSIVHGHPSQMRPQVLP